MSTNIKRARAALTPEIVKPFDELSKSSKDISAEALINYDETSMQNNSNSKIIAQQTCKYPERILDYTKSSFSVMFPGSASGTLLDLYVVYKSDNMYGSWTEGDPAGIRYSCSKSGWFEGNIFQNWFESIALPYLKTEGDYCKAIVGGNLASHLSIKVDDKGGKISLHDSDVKLSLLLESDIGEKLEDIQLPSTSAGQNTIYMEIINEFGASTSAPKQQINNFVIVKFFYDKRRRNE
ncbi:hypothetical protein ILUMI_19192 [Ignelater luminosus]|uniref:DDE-1 domain-containing protein n=1 Tax=Ignelater luminosus TaxID=2038154 RepID=A0A8K0G5T9_IGNLU|nr:hypothetical protein ILUMI_19192 [Ignelater luminosus]